MAALSPALQDAFNKQAVNEMGNAMFYLNANGVFYFHELTGLGRLMENQAKGEMEHSKLFRREVRTRQGLAFMGAIPEQPVSEGLKPVDIAVMVYKREQATTEQINALYKMATAEGDFEALVFLDFFANEQPEEEDGAWRLWKALLRVGNDQGALELLDKNAKKVGW